MSFAEKVQCYLCEKEESLLWHQCDKGVRCNECHESVTSMKSEVDASEDQEQDPPDDIKSKKRNKNNRRCTASQKSTSTPRQVRFRQVQQQRSFVCGLGFDQSKSRSSLTMFAVPNMLPPTELTQRSLVERPHNLRPKLLFLGSLFIYLDSTALVALWNDLQLICLGLL